MALSSPEAVGRNGLYHPNNVASPDACSHSSVTTHPSRGEIDAQDTNSQPHTTAPALFPMDEDFEKEEEIEMAKTQEAAREQRSRKPRRRGTGVTVSEMLAIGQQVVGPDLPNSVGEQDIRVTEVLLRSIEDQKKYFQIDQAWFAKTHSEEVKKAKERERWIQRLRHPPPVTKVSFRPLTPREEARRLASGFRETLKQSPLRVAPDVHPQEQTKVSEEKSAEQHHAAVEEKSAPLYSQVTVLPLTFPYVRHHKMLCREEDRRRREQDKSLASLSSFDMRVMSWLQRVKMPSKAEIRKTCRELDIPEINENGQPVRRFDEEVERPVHVTRYQHDSTGCSPSPARPIPKSIDTSGPESTSPICLSQSLEALLAVSSSPLLHRNSTVFERNPLAGKGRKLTEIVFPASKRKLGSPPTLSPSDSFTGTSFQRTTNLLFAASRPSP